MLKIKILSVGKTKEGWLDTALGEYLKRLTGRASVEFVWFKNDLLLTQAALQDPFTICLDPDGQSFTSEQFSSFLEAKLCECGSRLVFVIGGADGLAPELKQRGSLISLSRMTLTHQMTRLLLMEQIYRGLEIARGSQYHR